MKTKIKDIASNAIVGAIYIALTLSLYHLSFGPLQLRLSEGLILLCYFNKKYAPGFLIGVFISNLFGYGIIDSIVGTLSSGIAIFLITKIKPLWFASLMPTFTAILVALEVSLLTKVPFWICALDICLSVALVCSVIWLILFALLAKNDKFLNLIDNRRSKDEIFA